MARRRKGRAVHGWLNLDKPYGMTSTAAVARVRRAFGAAKTGHGGTLDPLASGVLPIALGEATKTVAYAMDATKTYRFTVRWGVKRTTDDAEGEIVATSDIRPPRAAIEAALPGFEGVIRQVPPAFSAIKVAGERAYDLARDGEAVELAPRDVTIDRLTLLEMPDADHAVFEAVCGKGTYMRALARDLAEALGTVGHVASLTRTAVGAFRLDAAVSLDHLDAQSAKGLADDLLLPVETPLDDIPAVALTEEEAHRMRCGQPVALLRRSDLQRLEELRGQADEHNAIVFARSADGPVAIARLVGAELHPVRVLNLTP